MQRVDGPGALTAVGVGTIRSKRRLCCGNATEDDVNKGDEVTIESGMFAGKTGELVELDRAAGLATVSVEAFGDHRETRVPVDDVSRVGMTRDEARKRLRERIEEALDELTGLRQRLWWGRRTITSSPGRSPSAELLEEFEQKRAEWRGERDERLDELMEQADKAIESVGDDQVRARAIGFREDVIEAVRDDARDIKDSFLEEHLSEEERRELRQQAGGDAEGSDVLDEEGAALRAEDRLISEIVDEGLSLWQECADLQAIESQGGFAWSAVQPGTVDLSVDPPKDEVPDAADEADARLDVPPSLDGSGEPRRWRRTIPDAASGASEPYANTAAGGLVTREGLIEPFSAQPYDLEGIASVDEAVERIFGPLQSRMPATYRLVHQRCIAVAEIDGRADGALGYLLAPAKGRADACKLLVGLPAEDDEVVSLDAEGGAEDGRFQLPMALRELRSRHGELRVGDLHIAGEFAELETHMEDESPITGPGDDYAPGRFVTFGRTDDDTYLFFDRDELDERNDPMVGRWSVGGRVSPRRAFWRVIDDVLSHM